MEALEFLKLMLDPDRLAVTGLVALRPATAAELAAATGQRERDVLAALAPLLRGGVVARDGDAYRLVVEGMRAMAQHLPQPPAAAREVARGMTADEAVLLGRFFQGTRLVEIPSSRTKRLVVLERLALEFDLGRRYGEPEANERFRRFHDDHATLRRTLVDEGFLDRSGGEYWRAGGRVVA
ncbi:hypothetical protein BH20ACT8_BH20ACT8_11930 [soil metagenome]